MKLPEVSEQQSSVNIECLESPEIPEIPLSVQEIFHLISRTYFQINNDFGNFNDELLFLVCEVYKESDFYNKNDFKDLVVLSLNFVLGFIKFRCEEMVSVSEIFSENAENYFFYNYAFLKFMTPLAEKAEVYCFSQRKVSENEIKTDFKKFAATLIFDLSRILFFLRNKDFIYSKSELDTLKDELNCSESVDFFYKADLHLELTQKLKNRFYDPIIDSCISEISFSEEEKFTYLKFLINIFDFKSTQTFLHTISTACYAYSLGKKVGFDKIGLSELFVAGILHDIGKMAIPRSVLESRGKLSSSDFTLMRSHVYFSKKMLSGVVPTNIFKIAIHHHEKIDGSGYPDGLSEQDLSTQERILTLVDIFSALAQSRSYKREYSKEEILKILKDLSDNHQIDSDLFSVLASNYDSFKKDAEDMKIIFNSPVGQANLFYEEMLL